MYLDIEANLYSTFYECVLAIITLLNFSVTWSNSPHDRSVEYDLAAAEADIRALCFPRNQVHYLHLKVLLVIHVSCGGVQ
jgi:hypothetical protein